MVLDTNIKKAAEALGIREVGDWQRVRPEEVRTVHGCGPRTLDHIRLYLAHRGLTLRDDGTPGFWQRNLDSAMIGGQLSPVDRAATVPFTIIIDVQEKQPFTFAGITGDAVEDFRPLIVPTMIASLGPTHGDYAIHGYEGRCHVERKGVGDAIGTFLAHGERRDRWIATLEFLAGIESAAVVIEDSFAKCMGEIQSRGKRSVGELRKTFHRQVLAWHQDYRVPFVFCDKSREGRPRLAELTTFAILQRFFRHTNGIDGKGAKTKIDPSLLAAIEDL
jgi:hypothetical protein